MPTFQTFKDLSVTFKKHPVTNDLIQVKDKAAIVQAMTSLILTNKGERLFQPEIGCDVSGMLFEPLDFGTAGLIKSSIKETLDRFEQRISVNDILCTPDYDNNGYSVEVFYTIVGRDDQPVGIQFFLERTR
mgnify:FL=1